MRMDDLSGEVFSTDALAGVGAFDPDDQLEMANTLIQDMQRLNISYRDLWTGRGTSLGCSTVCV